MNFSYCGRFSDITGVLTGDGTYAGRDDEAYTVKPFVMHECLLIADDETSFSVCFSTI
ncbi:hypothetical protein ACXWSV_09050 [Streptococcus pyogenes]